MASRRVVTDIGQSDRRSTRSNTLPNTSRSSKDFDEEEMISASPSGFTAESVMVQGPQPAAVKKTKPQGLLDAYGIPISGASLGAKKVVKAGKKVAKKDKSEMEQKIRVCVRKRPMNEKELRRGDTDVIDIKSRKKLVLNEHK